VTVSLKICVLDGKLQQTTGFLTENQLVFFVGGAKSIVEFSPTKLCAPYLSNYSMFDHRFANNK
jgi:hypothetical protein